MGDPARGFPLPFNIIRSRTQDPGGRAFLMGAGPRFFPKRICLRE
jgi:hypothetical protein